MTSFEKTWPPICSGLGRVIGITGGLLFALGGWVRLRPRTKDMVSHDEVGRGGGRDQGDQELGISRLTSILQWGAGQGVLRQEVTSAAIAAHQSRTVAP